MNRLGEQKALVQDEHVALVEAAALHRRLADPDVLGALEPQQPRLVLLRLDVVEAAVDPAGQDADAADLLEVAQEQGALLALDLAVLHRQVVQVGVQLDRLVGRRAHLVLGGLQAQPEVQVVQQLVAAGGAGGGGWETESK